MTKEEYIKTITQTAATLLAGQPRPSDFGTITAYIQIAVADAGQIFGEAVKLADAEFEASEGVTYAEKLF
jgi:hypothetical protein